MKPKIPTSRIPSDECAINIGQIVEDGEIIDPGIPHYIHLGESVEIIPIVTVKEVVYLSRLQQGVNDSANFGDSLDRLCQELSKRIVAWDWTDLMGEVMEQPYNRPDVLAALTSDELLWLVGATNGQESDDTRKKDSAPSANTLSATAPSPVASPSA